MVDQKGPSDVLVVVVVVCVCVCVRVRDGDVFSSRRMSPHGWFFRSMRRVYMIGCEIGSPIWMTYLLCCPLRGKSQLGFI